MGTSIIGGIAALMLGSAVAGATVFGLVSAQNSAPSQSPANVNQPVIEYGQN
ncbi:DUF2613 family protein [Nocardioides sp. GCM10027113]|uniref:DUF2613 family protein n=1 Tax=unclassified Nocardioides TaxID=2615069 RepID=UPI003613C1ED